MTASIAQQGENWVLSIPKNKVSDELFKRLVEWIEFLNLIQQSELTEEDAWDLSESIKADWWKENRERILKKIGEA